MSREYVDVSTIIECILNECHKSTQKMLMVELLKKYGNEDVCIEAFGNALLDNFSESTVIDHFNFELKEEDE